MFIAYNLKMSNGAAIPRFLSIERENKNVVINSPYINMSPSEEGLFALQLSVRDIYGRESAVNFNINV